MKGEELMRRRAELSGRPEHPQNGEAALRAAVARWRHRPQVNNGPIEAVILSELGRIRNQIDGLEQIILVRLYLTLEKGFSDEELRGLCFTLGVDYESLPGDGRHGRIRELIGHLLRRGRLGDLIMEYRRLRPPGRL